jgi:hypothetical protein
MSVPSDLGVPPTRADVRERILALIGNDESREVVSNWAAQWIRLPYPNIDDADVWKAIQRLSGADLRLSKEKYLHTDQDFLAWARDLQDL